MNSMKHQRQLLSITSSGVRHDQLHRLSELDALRTTDDDGTEQVIVELSAIGRIPTHLEEEFLLPSLTDGTRGNDQ